MMRHRFFDVVKILDAKGIFRKQASAAPTSKFVQIEYEEDVTFDAVAIGCQPADRSGVEEGYDANGESFSFLAIACGGGSRGRPFLRYASTRGSLPIIHHVEWPRNPLKRIRTMAFSVNLKTLLCIAYDGSIYVVPALSMVLRSRYDVSSRKTDAPEVLRSDGSGPSLFKLAEKRANERGVPWKISSK